jgi:hypothetical protein
VPSHPVPAEHDPAEVDIVLAHLAAAVGALPQTARQLGSILEQAKGDHLLQMDSLTETQDPDLAAETQRLHLDAIGEPALDVHRHLDAAHNETAHIATADREAGHGPGRSGLHLGRPSAGGPATATYWFGWNLASSSAVTGGRPSPRCARIALRSPHGEVSNPDIVVGEHDYCASGQVFGYIVKVVQEGRSLVLRTAVSLTEEH